MRGYRADISGIEKIPITDEDDLYNGLLFNQNFY